MSCGTARYPAESYITRLPVKPLTFARILGSAFNVTFCRPGRFFFRSIVKLQTCRAEPGQARPVRSIVSRLRIGADLIRHVHICTRRTTRALRGKDVGRWILFSLSFFFVFLFFYEPVATGVFKSAAEIAFLKLASVPEKETPFSILPTLKSSRCTWGAQAIGGKHVRFVSRFLRSLSKRAIARD